MKYQGVALKSGEGRGSFSFTVVNSDSFLRIGSLEQLFKRTGHKTSSRFILFCSYIFQIIKKCHLTLDILN